MLARRGSEYRWSQVLWLVKHILIRLINLAQRPVVCVLNRKSCYRCDAMCYIELDWGEWSSGMRKRNLWSYGATTSMPSWTSASPVSLRALLLVSNCRFGHLSCLRKSTLVYKTMHAAPTRDKQKEARMLQPLGEGTLKIFLWRCRREWILKVKSLVYVERKS